MTRSRDTGNVGYRAYKKNLLINGGFTVWQRGTNFPTAGFTADRFGIDTNNTASQSTSGIPDSAPYGLQVVSTGNAPAIYQPIELGREGHAGQFGIGRTFTLSAYVSSTTTGSLNVAPIFRDFSNNGTNQVVATAQQQVTVSPTVAKIVMTFTITGAPAPTNKLLDIVIYGEGALPDFTISEVQLEEGTTATPFEYRPIGEELALCQRYYQVDSSSTLIWSGQTTAGTVLSVSAQFPVTMRSIPTIDITGTAVSSAFSGASATLGYAERVGVRFSCTATNTSALGYYIPNYRADAEL